MGIRERPTYAAGGMQQSGHPAPAPVNGPFGFVVIDKPAGLTSMPA